MERRLFWFLVLLLPVLAWSWIRPFDRFTWWLEAAPAIIGVALILVFRQRFPLTTLLLVLVWAHCVILLLGAHYTYAHVPLFDWLRDLLDGSRNNYDKVGHFAQGFVPAILAREILLRTSPLGNRGDGRPSRWLPPLVACVCLAFSALYELVEWVTALLAGEAADEFLGMQGDAWDTQSDMALALAGALLALATLSRLHDRALARLAARR
jgi:putative membrane protein